MASRPITRNSSPPPAGWTRRQLLALVGAAVPGLLPGAAAAVRDSARFTFAQLRHGIGWNPRPTALRRLLWELSRRTSIEVEADAQQLAPCNQELFFLPLAYLAVTDALSPFPDCAVAALRTYLNHGGTLIVDAVSGGRESAFGLSLATAFAPVLSQELKAVPRSHVVYNAFYLLDSAAGRSDACPDLDAISVDDRLAVIVCHNDLGGAWARSNLGLWEHEVIPGGEDQRERAFRLGINLVMYALCIDYKEDKVHIPFILRKRRR